MASLAMRGAIGVRSQSPIESGDTFSVPFPQLRTPAARWAIGVSAASPDRRRRPAAGCHGKAGAGCCVARRLHAVYASLQRWMWWCLNKVPKYPDLWQFYEFHGQ